MRIWCKKVAYSHTLLKLSFHSDRQIPFFCPISLLIHRCNPFSLLSRLTTLQPSHKIWPSGGYGFTESLFPSLIPYEHHFMSCKNCNWLMPKASINRHIRKHSISSVILYFPSIVTMVRKMLTDWNVRVTHYIFQCSQQVNILTNGPMNFETNLKKINFLLFLWKWVYSITVLAGHNTIQIFVAHNERFIFK